LAELERPVCAPESPSGEEADASFGEIGRSPATIIHNGSLFPACRRLKRAFYFAAGASLNKRPGMSRGALAWPALTVAGLFVAVLFNQPIDQTPSAAGRSASERLRVAPDMMGILRDEHDLFEDVSREQPPAEPSSTEQLTAELLVPEQWAPRPGSFAPLVPEDAEPEQGEEAQKPDQPAAPVTAVQVFLLLGGLVGADGTVTSAGMFHLASMLRALPDTTVTTYNWNKWPDAYRAILANQGKAKIVVIGYSGGGSRATWLANMPSKPKIDLMVHYDPSPRWQMKPIGINVKKALCYHNTRPMMWVPGIGSLGGGELVANVTADDVLATPAIETVDIAEQHFLVQVDQSLHQRTVEAVRSLLGPPAAQVAPNLSSSAQYRLVTRHRATALVPPAADGGPFSLAAL
jgi:pimeloyl-ACP methyl ester carboxylesterase